MTEITRKRGIEVLEDCSWGTHICLFSETKEDLLETLVPYFKAGLENNEHCMWITSELLTKNEIVGAMREVVSHFDSYMEKKQIEIIPAKDWYLIDNAFNSERTLDDWIQKIDSIVKNGYDGLRVFGDLLWVGKKNWDKFKDYEAEVNEVLLDFPMLAICSYSLTKYNSKEIIEALRNHQYALIKYDGKWERFNNSIEMEDEYNLEERIKKVEAKNKQLSESQEKYQKVFEEVDFFKDLLMHDFNNVLSNIKASTELSLGLLLQPEKTEEIKELIEITMDQIDRGSKLVKNIHKLSELDKNEITLKKIDLCKSLKNIIKYVKNSNQERKIKIRVDSFTKIVFVQANELITDVFENILVNAVNYNENPTIEILIRISRHLIQKKSYVKLEFLDNGIGIQDERKKIIFQKSNGTSKNSKGMGIGLSLVKKAVLSYNGQIWVEDKVKGDYSRGSNFVLLIPQTV